MELSKKLGCVVMAAGNARRFGENKLAATVEGKSLILRALEAVPAELFAAVSVVTQYDEVTALAAQFGFLAVKNEHPDWGISHTISLGMGSLSDCDAILFEVSDQPLLQRESVAAELAFFLAHPNRIVALGHGGVRGNPCIFPRRFFPELLALRGDCGGNAVIRAHPEDCLLYEVAQKELSDVDSPAELAEILQKV